MIGPTGALDAAPRSSFATPLGLGSTAASAAADRDRGVSAAVHPATVGGAPHLGGHLVQRQVEGGHLVVGGGLGPDHRALGERSELDADGTVGLARVAFLLDLDLDADHPMVVLLQPGELLLDMLAEPSVSSQCRLLSTMSM